MSESDNGNSRFLKALGFGKQESVWITQYDGFPLRDRFRSDYNLVGREFLKTNPYCGTHRRFLKCDNASEHGSIGGRDFYHNNVTNCHLYKCHTCWKFGWCVFRANQIESRFLTAQRVLGLPIESVEHLSASVPKELYELSPKDMQKECIRACKRRGIDGVSILHPFRKDQKRRDLYKSFHYHVLGYIKPSYDHCRSCIKGGCCSDCDGFEGVTRRAYKDDNWIVSLAKNEDGVIEKRKSIFGTSWYQCEHSGYKVGVKNFQIVEWFGVVAKRKFKTVVKRLEFTCPICSNTLEPSPLPLNAELIPSNRGERGFMKNFTLPHVDRDDEFYRDHTATNGGV
jgi:hypothetical protein